MKRVLGLSLLTALALGLPAFGAPRPRHAADVTTVVVEVPVQVVDRSGAPVRGLGAGHFTVHEGRRQRTITDFEVIDLAAPRAGATPPADTLTVTSSSPWSPAPVVPAAGRRHFLLLFDLTFSEPAKLTRARHAARDLVAQRLHPTDLVAVATYGWTTGARWVLGFSSDRRQISAAIEDLGLGNSTEWTMDPLGLMRVADRKAPGGSAGAGEAITDAAFQDRLAELSVMVDRMERNVHRGHATAMMQGFRALAERLQWVPGRKHVLLLSQGFDSELLLGTQDPRRMQAMSEAAIAGRPWTVDSQERYGDTASIGRLGRLLDTLRRADATVHAVDITGILADPRAIMARPGGEDSLFLMADGTGGELYRGFNDAGEAMEQLLDRTSVTYLLAFEPTDLAIDGSYHPLRVRLKGGPEGARVIHRPGYYAPLPFSAQSAEARQMAAAELVLGGEVGGPIPVAALAAPVSGGDDELAHVPLMVEIDGPALLAEASDAPNVLLDLYAYAIDADREVRDFVSQQMGLDLGSLGPALRERGVKFLGHLDLPPGGYRIRVLVRELASGRATIQETAVLVPRNDERQPAILPPLFPDMPPDWLTVREQPRAGRPPAPPHPFLLDGRPFTPASRPVITAGVPAELLLMAYHAAAAGRRLEGRVLDAAGTEVGPAALQRVSTTAGAQPGLELLTARFVPAGLKPGQYTLEVRLIDPSSGEALTSSIPFLVRLPGRDIEPQQASVGVAGPLREGGRS